MTPEKQDKTLELSKHWFVDSTPARNEVIMKRTYPVKSVKKIRKSPKLRHKTNLLKKFTRLIMTTKSKRISWAM